MSVLLSIDPAFNVCFSFYRTCLLCLSLCSQNPFPASGILSTIPVLSVCPVYSTFLGICLPFCSTCFQCCFFHPQNLPSVCTLQKCMPVCQKFVHICLSKFFSLMQKVRVLYKYWDKDNHIKSLPAAQFVCSLSIL